MLDPSRSTRHFAIIMEIIRTEFGLRRLKCATDLHRTAHVSSMPSAIRRPDPSENPTDLRVRALRIRDHASNFASDVAGPRMLALAAEFEAQAAALDADGKSVWDQVSAGWTRKE